MYTPLTSDAVEHSLILSHTVVVLSRRRPLRGTLPPQSRNILECVMQQKIVAKWKLRENRQKTLSTQKRVEKGLLY